MKHPFLVIQILRANALCLESDNPATRAKVIASLNMLADTLDAEDPAHDADMQALRKEQLEADFSDDYERADEARYNTDD